MLSKIIQHEKTKKFFIKGTVFNELVDKVNKKEAAELALKNDLHDKDLLIEQLQKKIKTYQEELRSTQENIDQQTKEYQRKIDQYETILLEFSEMVVRKIYSFEESIEHLERLLSKTNEIIVIIDIARDVNQKVSNDFNNISDRFINTINHVNTFNINNQNLSRKIPELLNINKEIYDILEKLHVININININIEAARLSIPAFKIIGSDIAKLKEEIRRKLPLSEKFINENILANISETTAFCQKIDTDIEQSQSYLKKSKDSMLELKNSADIFIKEIHDINEVIKYYLNFVKGMKEELIELKNIVDARTSQSSKTSTLGNTIILFDETIINEKNNKPTPQKHKEIKPIEDLENL